MYAFAFGLTANIYSFYRSTSPSYNPSVYSSQLLTISSLFKPLVITRFTWALCLPATAGTKLGQPYLPFGRYPLGLM